MPWATNEPAIEDLTHEALKLLSFDLDELYAVLGCQLLGAARPTRAAQLLVCITELGSAPADARPGSRNVEEIAGDLRGDGSRFIEATRDDFRRSLCTKEILDLTENIDASRMQILILLISAVLKMPPQFESISATLAAMFCKSLLREMCQ